MVLEPALDRFLASVERRAYRMAQLAIGNPDDALDIVQDAMLVWVRRYGEHPESDWGALFQTVLQSRITDWHRRSAVRKRWRVWLSFGRNDEDEADGGDVLEQFPDSAAADPARKLADGRAIEQLEQGLGRLPLRQRQAFLLRAWEGLDVSETARAMGCGEGSVKTHYARALQALRTQLGDHWSA